MICVRPAHHAQLSVNNEYKLLVMWMFRVKNKTISISLRPGYMTTGTDSPTPSKINIHEYISSTGAPCDWDPKGLVAS